MGQEGSDRAVPALAEEQSLLDEQGEDEITVDVKKMLNEAVRKAEESPLPDPSALYEGVYADPEELDTPHHR